VIKAMIARQRDPGRWFEEIPATWSLPSSQTRECGS
jgi:hypothetical protein